MVGALPLSRLWPASGIRAVAGDLELRWIDDDTLAQLAELAARGVHSPDVMPFKHPWTRGTPDEVARHVLAYQWNVRSQLSPERFILELAVVHNGVVVGVQAINGYDWPVLRSVTSGSWLGLEYQGRGIGTRMRMIALHLAFEGLGASDASTSAYADNAASNAVSERVGYVPDGAERVARDGRATLHNRYVMSRELWATLRTAHVQALGSPVRLEGTAGVLEQLGTPRE